MSEAEDVRDERDTEEGQAAALLLSMSSSPRPALTPPSGANASSTSRVLHYKIDLPPCFHRDGKDKDGFSLWRARFELAIKACTESGQRDRATLLPTRLSGDALAYWLSLPPAVQKDYDATVKKMNEVFGRKQFLLHFQTFVNARQRLPKEPLEVFAAEITRLVLEAFPNYGQAALDMERFRRFLAGLDPMLQLKCHEHGASSLEEALAIAAKWERAQEALRLAAPAQAPATAPYSQASLTENPSPSISAMVSSKSVSGPSEQQSQLKQAIEDLRADVRALRLEVTDLKQQSSH